MPGTIHVSVLGFVGLPSSSISVKVSMGKREYQTVENGDVSFPLVSLRENVIVTLFDTEGNQISHTGIQTILVVEKGLWVDYFPLEGGGHVHMKLQFILSEGDRNRIRMMRESALKKKQSELLNNRWQSSVTTSSITNTAALSFSKNCEVSVTSSGEAATQVSVVSNPVSLFMDPQSADGIQEETHVATQVNMVSDPVSLCTPPQSNTGIEDDTQVVTQVSCVSVPVSLYTDSQSTTVTEEESHVATQISRVSNLVSLYTDPEPTTETEEETYVATSVSMVSNPINMDPQCASEEEESHIAQEPQLNSNNTDSTINSEAPSSTAITSQANEVDISDVYFQGSNEIKRTKEVSSQALVETNGTKESSHPSVEIDRYDVSPQASTEVIEMHSTSIDGSTNPKIGQSQMVSSEMMLNAKQKPHSFLPKLERDQTEDKEKQGTINKTPSSVKKMINAFESSQVQDKKFGSKPSIVKSPSSKFIMEAPSKDQDPKEAKAESNKAKPAWTIDESKSTQTIVISKDLRTEQNHFNGSNSSLKNEGLRVVKSEVANKNTLDLFHILREIASQQNKPQPNDYEPTKIISSSSEAVVGVPSNDAESRELSLEQNHYNGANSSSNDGAVGKVHSEVVKREHKEVPVLVRVSISKAISSGQTYTELPPTSCCDSGESGASTAVVECTQEHFTKDSFTADIERDVNDTLESSGCCEDKQDLHKSSSTWIFPNEKRQVCLTTGGRAESTSTYQARTSFSVKGHLKENILYDDDTFCTMRDTDLDNSKVAHCRGPFGQAIKIAIMVGFGILVLSGQRTKR